MKGTPSLSSPSHHDPLPPAQAVLGGPGGGKQSPEGSEGGALELGRQQQPCSQDLGRQSQDARVRKPCCRRGPGSDLAGSQVSSDFLGTPFLGTNLVLAPPPQDPSRVSTAYTEPGGQGLGGCRHRSFCVFTARSGPGTGRQLWRRQPRCPFLCPRDPGRK